MLRIYELHMLPMYGKSSLKRPTEICLYHGRYNDTIWLVWPNRGELVTDRLISINPIRRDSTRNRVSSPQLAVKECMRKTRLADRRTLRNSDIRGSPCDVIENQKWQRMSETEAWQTGSGSRILAQLQGTT
jgi:hypothetical protein